MNSSQEIKLIVSDLSYSLRRFFVDEFYGRNISLLYPLGGSVLDLGGCKIQKRGQFNVENYPVSVVYANLSRDKCPDIQCDAASLPFSSESFSAVLCSELLEHVSCPRVVLEEIYRLLKPGGILLVTAPFLVQTHSDPHDFARYTDQYWRESLHQAGFEKIEVENQGYFWSVLMDMLRYYYSSSNTKNSGLFKSLLRWLLGKGVILGRKWILPKEKTIAKMNSATSCFTTGYGVVAKKPDHASKSPNRK